MEYNGYAVIDKVGILPIDGLESIAEEAQGMDLSQKGVIPIQTPGYSGTLHYSGSSKSHFGINGPYMEAFVKADGSASEAYVSFVLAPSKIEHKPVSDGSKHRCPGHAVTISVYAAVPMDD